MRIFTPVIVLFCLVSGALAASSSKMPWLGVVLDRASATEKDRQFLPKGVGLLVKKVTAQGPLEKAGGKAGDLWWKLDDQILVNMGQLVVLLKMREPGNEVKLQFYRDGKLQELNVTLGERPAELFTKRAQELVVHREPQKEEIEEVAEMTSGGYLYRLKDGVDGLYFAVSQDEKILFNGPVTALASAKTARPEWQGVLLILRQALAARGEKWEKEEKSPLRRRYAPLPSQK